MLLGLYICLTDTGYTVLLTLSSIRPQGLSIAVVRRLLTTFLQMDRVPEELNACPRGGRRRASAGLRGRAGDCVKKESADDADLL